MFDIIGDVHGQLTALRGLLPALGFQPNGSSYSSPAGRHIIFVGDIVDYGPDSLGVSQLVKRLVDDGVATCLMGNHEYNLLEAWYGIQSPRKSGQVVYDDACANPEWEPIIEFLGTLPIAMEFEHFRVIHAIWDDRAMPALGALEHAGAHSPNCPSTRWFASPFVDQAIRPDLPTFLIPESNDVPHAVVIKGTEDIAEEPFVDTAGKTRTNVRVCWWKSYPSDAKLTIFGHFRTLPPFGDSPLFAASHPQGTPEYDAWIKDHHYRVPEKGQVAVPDHIRGVCVDHQGVTAFREEGAPRVQVLGAFRWPERDVIWRTFDAQALASRVANP